MPDILGNTVYGFGVYGSEEVKITELQDSKEVQILKQKCQKEIEKNDLEKVL